MATGIRARLKEHLSEAITPAELRKFGLVTAAMVIGFVGVLLPWLGGRDILHWQRITAPVGGVLILWAMVHPASLILVYRPWMLFAEVLGWINTRIILAIVFYLLFVPVGMIMRMAGNDPMQRQLQPEARSYRTNSTVSDNHHMEHPY